MQKIKKKVEEKLSALRDCSGQLYVACSGGLDSMALLEILRTTSAALTSVPPPHILHVNYGLRGQESDDDEDFLRTYGKIHKLSISVLDLRQEPKPSQGIQDWARKKRYSWFLNISKAKDCIAIAHTRSDLAENVLLRLARGVGDNLLGMAVESGRLWRPLLNVPRTELQEYMIRQNIPHREDSSNAKLVYSRNKIRLQVFPVLEDIAPHAEQRIVYTARDIDEILRELDLQNKSIWSQEKLYVQDILGCSAALARRFITLFLKGQDAEIELNRSLIADIYEALCSQKDLTRELKGYCRVLVRGGTLEVQFKEAFAGYSKQYSRFLKGEPKLFLGSGAKINRNES